ncbi:MAG: T9SS type A sorting domain-containing protein, partial [Bacteroidota bacterium]
SSDGLGLSLSPNPTTGPLRVSWEGLSEYTSGDLQILDLQGRSLLRRTLDLNQREFAADLSTFPAGVYVIQLQLEDQLLSKKVRKR